MPTVHADEMVWIDTAAMREIDRIMVDELGIRLLQMMENAGRSLARLVRSQATPTSVLVLAGSGGNGGGGLVAARHLANGGVDVAVQLTSPRDRLAPVTALQLGILDQMGVPVVEGRSITAGAVIDAMVGYSLSGPLRGDVLEASQRLRGPLRGDVLEASQRLRGPHHVVSLDVPSGTDATTGSVAEGGVHADLTMTLCAPKIGLRDAPTVGDLYVADISVPPAVVIEVGGGPAPPFERGPVLAVTG